MKIRSGFLYLQGDSIIMQKNISVFYNLKQKTLSPMALTLQFLTNFVLSKEARR